MDSSDLTALDFFRCGYLKVRVHVNKQKIIPELNNNIRNDIRGITTEILLKENEPHL